MAKKTHRKKAKKPTVKAKPTRQAGELQSKFFLEKFTSLDFKRWRRNSDLLTLYHYKYYYCLESQRTAHYEALYNALRESFNKTPLKIDNWVRTVDYQYSLQPLSSEGSIVWAGGRFNIGREVKPDIFPVFNALYLAETQETALRERFGNKSSGKSDSLSRDELNLLPANSYSLVRIQGEIHHFFDLTKLSGLMPFVKIVKNFKISDDVKRLAVHLGLDPPH